MGTHCRPDETWLAELAGWLAIPSVSAEPEHRDDVRLAGEWVADFIRSAGGDAQIVDWNGQPLVVGELRASSGDSTEATPS